MIKKNLFEAKMKIHYDRQEDLAEALGISITTFNYRLNGKSDFTRTELQKIRERYSLTDEEFIEIFFD